MGDRVFTGDTLLDPRGTGRTDFQNGSARARSTIRFFNRLLETA